MCLATDDIIEKIVGLDYFPANIKNKLNELIKSQNRLNIKNLAGSLVSVFTIQTAEITKQPIIIIAENASKAENIKNDIQFYSNKFSVASLFETQKSFKNQINTHNEHLGEMLEGLSMTLSNNNLIAIATESIFREKLPIPDDLIKTKKTISKNDNINFNELKTELILNGFQKKDYVEIRGDIAIRGGIIDIFPVDYVNPLRIEFWGDTIDSIREFNVVSQRSILHHNSISFLSEVFHKSDEELSSDIFFYLPENSIIIFVGLNQYAEEIPLDFIREKYKTIEVNSLGNTDLKINSIEQPVFSASIRSFLLLVNKLITLNYKIAVSADGKIHLSRLKELIESAFYNLNDWEFNEKNENDKRLQNILNNILNISEISNIRTTTKNGFNKNTLLNENLDIDTLYNNFYNNIHWYEEAPSAGFINNDSRIAIFTEHQIFDRKKIRTNKQHKKSVNQAANLLMQLNPGDFVVHEDKGVACFEGFKSVKLGSSNQDCVRLRFANNDILYVHLNYIHKIQKYSAQEGHTPLLSKLGSSEWKRKKSKAKQRLKDIARDLIKLYAERKTQKGFSFPIDTTWQKEFEASFIYEDTIDQAKATEDLKRDMEDTSPMDRLICGDVGFGKTEVAIRAAFKAVQSGKQVAVLVPTTILAQQHYMTFLDRLNRFPVLTEVISRFRTKTEQNEILKKLKSGSVDILIGTHRLLSKDIQFKDLGLLIIDEEHRFGVGAKEKLRQLKVNVDTLTLTATPIPRTLNFSLMGARDLSVIETPPRNRIPVYTEIIEWNDDYIEEIIEKEIKRGGQVFFVNDRIEDLEKIALNLEMLMPNIKFATVHGQMPPSHIEKVMEKFVQGKFDVLLATKIIESGIDIPNANTMVINKAQNFGLAELYQLRGRVGRSNIQAYCYLVVPNANKMKQNALKRLQAIEEFTDLGSGLKLALRDMEIRGAGNLLGPEQSGYIVDIGFELFHKILDEAVEDLKTEEFSALFNLNTQDKQISFENDDLVIETDEDAFIPEIFIQNETDRFYFYKQLYNTRTQEELYNLTNEIQDRFGQFPEAFTELLFVVKLRIAGIKIGFTKIIVKENKLICEFPSETHTQFYEIAFPAIMDFINVLNDCQLNQNGKKLQCEFKLNTRNEAVEIIWKIKRTLELEVNEQS